MFSLNNITPILFFIAWFMAGCQDNNDVQRKPNIIFILTDDQRWDAMGYAGNPIIKTPEMDKLARDGVYFRNAFVTTPICAASRASFLTGLHERTHGYTFMQGNLKNVYRDLSYPGILKRHGYYTGFYGKLGVEIEKADSLFDMAEIYDRNNNEANRRGYFYKTLGHDTVHLTRYTGEKALDFIRNAPDSVPFCLSLSFSAPHAHDPAPEQYFWQEKSDSLFRDFIMPPPKIAQDSIFRALPKEVQEGFNRTRWYWRFDTPEKYQFSMKGYYRMVTEIDDEIRQIRSMLKEKGISENTIIILMGDNGYFLGERQLAGKWLLYDHSLRVPLIIYDPRHATHRDVSDMVTNVDVTATILDLAGIKPPVVYQGNSLVPLMSGDNTLQRDRILVEHLWNFPMIPSSEGIRTAQWKYFRYRHIDAPEELYNLHEDPNEVHNLVGDPAYYRLVNALRSSLDSLIQQYHDEKIFLENN